MDLSSPEWSFGELPFFQASRHFVSPGLASVYCFFMNGFVDIFAVQFLHLKSTSQWF